MKQPDMRRVNGAHSSRWPVIRDIVQAAEPIGAAMGDIRRQCGLDCYKVAAYVNHYCKAGYLVSAGPRGSKRYYLTREKADAASALRDANPVVSIERKTPKLRGSVMSGLLEMMDKAGSAGVSAAEFADALQIDSGQVRQSLSDLRRHGRVFSLGDGKLRRHFGSEEWAAAYAVRLPELEAGRRAIAAAAKVKHRERDVAAAKQRREAKRAEVKRTRGEELAKITWARRQQALELREHKRKEVEAKRAADKAAALEAKKAKAAQVLQVVKVASVRKPDPKPTQVEVITPAHVKVQRLEPKGFGRYHVDEKDVPSVFGNLTPGSYLPLPSRVGL